jgi:membrane protease YdiL (CAAX protease family)
MQKRDLRYWFVLVFALAFPTLATWLYFVHFAGAEAWIQKTSLFVGKVLQFVATPIVLLWLSKKQWAQSMQQVSHIPEPQTVSNEVQSPQKPFSFVIPVGIISGLLIGGTIILASVFWLIPARELQSLDEIMRAKLNDFSISSKTLFAALGLFYALFHSGMEELYWRCLVDRQLRPLMHPAASIAISSLGFMAHHVVIMGTYLGWTNPLAYLASLGVAIGGLIWAYFDRTQGRILGAWISHGLVDASLFIVGLMLLSR